MNREKIICFKMEDAEITSISTEKKNNVKAKWLIEMGKYYMNVIQFIKFELTAIKPARDFTGKFEERKEKAG
jgi:hypothetical protein